ncbi:MAG: hypothetical protein NTX50_24550, partial [Candidatus Sumerlaeota bacterium]|nr:hypothetical protein [Candidatus Sumerlaeota bacterium]
MQRLTLDLARPAFVLAKPAMDDKERTLIAEGTTLTGAHFEALRKRGVSAVFIEFRFRRRPVRPAHRGINHG